MIEKLGIFLTSCFSLKQFGCSEMQGKKNPALPKAEQVQGHSSPKFPSSVVQTSALCLGIVMTKLTEVTDDFAGTLQMTFPAVGFAAQAVLPLQEEGEKWAGKLSLQGGGKN